MKRSILSCLAVLVGFGLVWISALSVGQKQGYATDQTLSQTAFEASTAAEVIIPKQLNEQETVVDYYLPYPGILPDHGLYPLKMLRDRVRLITTSRGKEKAQLLLTFADKRIGATQALIQGGKATVGARTAVKAEGYLRRAVDEASKVNDASFLETLSQSSLKHREILIRSKDRLAGESLEDLDKAIETNTQLLQQLGVKVPEEDFFIVPEAVDAEVEINLEEFKPVEIGM